MPRQFDVVIELDEEGYYVASVPQIPGCHTQARSLDEVTQRIREAIELCLETGSIPVDNLAFVSVDSLLYRMQGAEGADTASCLVRMKLGFA